MEIGNFEIEREAILAFVGTVIVAGGALTVLSGGVTLPGSGGFEFPEGANRTSLQFSTVVEGHSQALSATDHVETVTVTGQNRSRTFYLTSDLTSRVALYNSSFSSVEVFLNYSEGMAYRSDGSVQPLTERTTSSFNPSLISLPLELLGSGTELLDAASYSYSGKESYRGVTVARYRIQGLDNASSPPVEINGGHVLVDSSSRVREMVVETELGKIRYELRMKELELERPEWAHNTTE